MKTRTYIVAWVFALLAARGAVLEWHLLINKLLGHVPLMAWGPRDQIIVIVKGCVLGALLAVGWANLIRRKPWAWKMVVILLPISGFITILDIFMAWHPALDYAALCLLSVLLDQLLPLGFLLTDRPSGWSQPANPQFEVPSPQ